MANRKRDCAPAGAPQRAKANGGISAEEFARMGERNLERVIVTQHKDRREDDLDIAP